MKTPVGTGFRPTLLAPWRRRIQWLTTLLLLLLPWLQAGGNSLLRIDIPQLRLYLFGQVLHIEELYLVLLFSLALALGFLLVTVVLGRVWCGWLCPQTTLSDIAEGLARRLGLKPRRRGFSGPLWRQALLHAAYLLLGFLVAANLLWYFIEPWRFFARLAAFDLHYASWIVLGGTAGLVYVDLAWVRRLLCREFCPYGRFQTALVDRSTLTLRLPETELARCIDCGSCVRACPMGIDIRQGYQVECINCGRCLDACRQVMARRGEPGLIGYRFGTAGEGAKALLNPRVLLPAVGMLVLLIGLGVALQGRAVVSLKVAVSHTAPPRQLADGQTATFFNAWVNNRSRTPAVYTLQARRLDDGTPIELKGQLRADLAPGENRRLDFVVLTPAEPLAIRLQLAAADGKVLASADAAVDGRREMGRK